MNNDDRNLDANRDPITGIGAAVGAAANRGASSLSGERAKHAARDAWNRISPSS